MAAKSRTSKSRVSKQTMVWFAFAAALLVANSVMIASVLFGHNYVADALKHSKRVEFDLEYDAQGNAIPQNLLGEPLDMETARLMADLATQQTDQPPAAEHQTPEIEPAAQEFAPIELPNTVPPPAETAPELPKEATPEPVPPQPEQQQNPPSAASTTTAPPKATPAPAEPALAPVEQRTEQGIIPVIAADGTKPWQYFAKQDYAKPTNKPRIAVIVSGLGLAALPTQNAIALPAEVTLSFSPYGRQATATLAAKARTAGHEIMLDLPMQTERYPAVDPGPYGIRKDLSTADNIIRLSAIMTKARGFVGLLGTMRDVVSNDTVRIVPLIEKLASHGLLFVAGHTQAPEGMFRIQRSAGVPVLMTDIVVDDHITESHIKNELARAEDYARTHGHALVVGHSYPLTIDLLAAWLKTLAQKGFAIVPVSALGSL